MKTLLTIRKIFCLLALGFGVLAPGPAWARLVSSEEVALAALDRLGPILEEQGQGLRATRVNVTKDLKLPDGLLSWRLRSTENLSIPGRYSVTMEASVDGQTAAVISCQVTVGRFVRVPVLIRSLERGEVVREGDLEVRELEMDDLHGDMVSQAADVVGAAAIRTLQPGKPLRTSWFQAEQVVRRGEKVKAVLQRKGLTIQVEGIALAPGAMGSIISVKNLTSNRPFFARVSGPGEVLVETP